MRLAILTSHPIQYHAPLFRELARKLDLCVYFAHRATVEDQARAGFGKAFEWDVDLTTGYENVFLKNVARAPGSDHFWGCDTPEIGERLCTERFDALFVIGWNLKTYLQGVLHAKRLGIPVMVRGDSHLDTPRSSFKKAIKDIAYPRFLRLFNAALYVGQRSRAYYEHYSYPAERLFFSPHAVDTQWFFERATLNARQELRARLGVSPQTCLILFAGKFVSFKRPLDLVQAVALCRKAGLDGELLMAGDGQLRQELTSAARDLRVPLHLLGFCNQTEMPSAYAAADILVLPSNGRETWGLVTNEALACGKPIVVSDACGCAPDLVEDGKTGYTFKMGDAADLKAAIERVFLCPPETKNLLAKARQYSLGAASEGAIAAFTYLTEFRR